MIDPHRRWEHPDLNVVLVEPEIPPNTGNIARLCAATHCHLILVGKLGFDITDRQLKRAGLDYWPWVSWEWIEDRDAWWKQQIPEKMHLMTVHTERPYTQCRFRQGDQILLGSETRGLPKSWLNEQKQRCCTLPMMDENVRSLNLATATSVVVFEALRQIRNF